MPEPHVPARLHQRRAGTIFKMTVSSGKNLETSAPLVELAPAGESNDVQLRCTSLSLRRAARAASQFLERRLLPLGLHSSQFGILSAISRAGSTTITDLSDEMSLDRTTLTRNLQILKRDGLVAVISGADRRVREVRLTERGNSVLQSAIPLWEQAEQALSSLLGDDQRRALLSLSETISTLETK